MATEAELKLIAELRNHCDSMNAIMEKFTSPLRLTFKIVKHEVVGKSAISYLTLEAEERTKL